MTKHPKLKLYGGIELGGTKTICAVGTVAGAIVAQTTIPTTTVEQTFAAVFKFFEANNAVSALGVGAFGPLQLDTAAADYGSIYNTPKSGWSKVDVKGLLERRLQAPVSIEVDVNCAALGEHAFGVAQGLHRFIYLTLGTGIGGSFVQEGQVVHGIRNLEMGHMRVPHEPFTGSFQGACSFHGDCLEGIASGHAVEQRYGQKGQDIADPHVWERQAGYIASAINNLMLTIGPERFVIGGGLSLHPGLMEAIRAGVQRTMNNYMVFPPLTEYIVVSSGSTNGVLGAIKLASL